MSKVDVLVSMYRFFLCRLLIVLHIFENTLPVVRHFDVWVWINGQTVVMFWWLPSSTLFLFSFPLRNTFLLVMSKIFLLVCHLGSFSKVNVLASSWRFFLWPIISRNDHIWKLKTRTTKHHSRSLHLKVRKHH